MPTMVHLHSVTHVHPGSGWNQNCISVDIPDDCLQRVRNSLDHAGTQVCDRRPDIQLNLHIHHPFGIRQIRIRLDLGNLFRDVLRRPLQRLGNGCEIHPAFSGYFVAAYIRLHRSIDDIWRGRMANLLNYFVYDVKTSIDVFTARLIFCCFSNSAGGAPSLMLLSTLVLSPLSLASTSFRFCLPAGPCRASPRSVIACFSVILPPSILRQRLHSRGCYAPESKSGDDPSRSNRPPPKLSAPD